MSTHNICFHGETRKIPILLVEKVPYQEHCLLKIKQGWLKQNKIERERITESQIQQTSDHISPGRRRYS